MDINDLENNLGNIDVKVGDILPELLKLVMHNNSLLRVILSNQADIYSKFDTDIDTKNLEKIWIEEAIQLTQELNLKFLSKTSS